MKNLNGKLGNFVFIGTLNFSQGQIKYDTIPLIKYNNYSPEFSYKTKEVWDDEKLNLIITNFSIREDKIDSTKEISQKCIKEVNLINNKWDKLNSMSLNDRYNYFEKKYSDDSLSVEVFPYD